MLAIQRTDRHMVAACWRALWFLIGLASAEGPPFAPMPDQLSPTATFSLLHGVPMPVLGVGVYLSRPGDETYNAVNWSLELGYRLIDSAAIYNNEASVGQAIRDSGVPREELFVVTKLAMRDHGFESTIAACRKSLSLLGLDYVDLYLIHAPHGGKLVETWDAMIELKRRGLVRAAGVSNFGVPHLTALREHGREVPDVNQIEMHPLVYKERVELLRHCQEHGILVQVYGSLFAGKMEYLKRQEVVDVVAAHPGKTPAQVLLRWGLQMGFQLIPKSVKRHRLQENLDIFDFDLSGPEMDLLSNMPGELGQYWDPTVSAVDLGDISRKPEL